MERQLGEFSLLWREHLSGRNLGTSEDARGIEQIFRNPTGSQLASYQLLPAEAYFKRGVALNKP